MTLTVVGFNDTWKVLPSQPLQSTGVDDPTGIAPIAFDDSAWADSPGAFLSAGASAGLVVPVTVPLGSNGNVLCQTAIGIDCEAYYRKHVGHRAGTITVRGWIDNWIWVFVNGTLVFSTFSGGGGEFTFGVTLPLTDNVLAVRSRSTGDVPSGAHIMAMRLFKPGGGWGGRRSGGSGF